MHNVAGLEVVFPWNQLNPMMSPSNGTAGGTEIRRESFFEKLLRLARRPRPGFGNVSLSLNAWGTAAEGHGRVFRVVRPLTLVERRAATELLFRLQDGPYGVSESNPLVRREVIFSASRGWKTMFPGMRVIWHESELVCIFHAVGQGLQFIPWTESIPDGERLREIFMKNASKPVVVAPAILPMDGDLAGILKEERRGIWAGGRS